MIPAMYTPTYTTRAQKKIVAPSAVVAFALPLTCAVSTRMMNGPRFSTRFACARTARSVHAGTASGASRLPKAHSLPPGAERRPAAYVVGMSRARSAVHTSIQRSVVMGPPWAVVGMGRRARSLLPHRGPLCVVVLALARLEHDDPLRADALVL